MHQYVSFYATFLHKHFSAFCNERLQRMGLSQGLLYFVLYVGKHPGCSPGELSASLHFDTGHTTRSIDKLMLTGFVSREKSETDKRSYALHLTEEGKKAFRLSQNLFKEWDETALTGLDDNDKQELFRLLNKLNLRKDFTL